MKGKLRTKKESSMTNEETQNLHRENNEDIIDFTGREPIDNQDIPVILKNYDLEYEKFYLKEEEFFISRYTENNKLFFSEFLKSFLNSMIVFMGTYLYIRSFSVYSDFPDDCLDEINDENLHSVVKYILLSAVSYIIELFLFINGYSYLYIISLEFVSVIFISFYYRNHSIMDENLFIMHKIVFFTIISLILIICLLFYLFRKIYITKKFKYLAITIIICSIIIIYIKESKENYEEVSKGFNNEIEIEDFEIPSIYTYSSFNYIKKLFFRKEVCSEINENEKENLKKNFGKLSSSFIKYPITNNYYTKNISQNHFVSIFNRDMINLYKDENSSFSEVLFNIQSSSVEINFEPNITLINERENIYSKIKNTTFAKNILMIYLDSISKNQFNREFKKTFNFMKSFYSNTSNKYEAFDFFNFSLNDKKDNKYHLKQSLFGINEEREKGSYFVKHFKEKGYITGNAINWCGKEVFRTNEEENNLEWENYDHEFVSIFCDPNYTPLLTSNKKCPTFIKKSCFYNTNSIDLLTTYTMTFWINYKSQAKLFRLGIMDGIDYIGDNLKYIDEKISNLLTVFNTLDILKDTVVFIYSNHGSRNSILFSLLKNNEYNIEKYRPTFYIFISKSLQYYKHMSQSLNNNKYTKISHYHIYDSLISLVSHESDLNSLFF